VAVGEEVGAGSGLGCFDGLHGEGGRGFGEVRVLFVLRII